MEGETKGLENLKVWQRTVDYAGDVCQRVVPLFPPDEKWALQSQLRRAVQSIPANIAEGYGRYGFQETIQFCYIARGSIAETKTHLLLAHRLGYVDDTIYQEYQSRLSELGKMLHGFINHLRKQKGNLGVRDHPELSQHDDM